MKLNVEKLAREAKLSYLIGIGDDDETRMYYEAWPEQLEAFARLIVERCAVECDSEVGWTNNAEIFAEKIRNMLEDK